jgi:DNA repair protein RadC
MDRPPVTRRQASRVLASLELGRRLAAVVNEREPIRDCTMLARPLMARYAHQVQEHLGATYLDSKHRIIREREIYVGTLNYATVSTRDVLRFALEDHSASLIRSRPSMISPWLKLFVPRSLNTSKSAAAIGTFRTA